MKNFELEFYSGIIFKREEEKVEDKRKIEEKKASFIETIMLKEVMNRKKRYEGLDLPFSNGELGPDVTPIYSFKNEHLIVLVEKKGGSIPWEKYKKLVNPYPIPRSDLWMMVSWGYSSNGPRFNRKFDPFSELTNEGLDKTLDKLIKLECVKEEDIFGSSEDLLKEKDESVDEIIMDLPRRCEAYLIKLREYVFREYKDKHFASKFGNISVEYIDGRIEQLVQSGRLRKFNEGHFNKGSTYFLSGFNEK